MPFEIVRNDIVNMHVDAIVNTANPEPVIGSSTDAAIHKAAGPMLLAARKKIGDIPVGYAAVTPGFDLFAKIVIHTPGPVWQGGGRGEEKALRQCYKASLQAALENHCESVAFPLMATGNYGFPKPLALQIAVSEFSSFLLEHDMQIYLVVFNRSAYELSSKLFHSVQSYIDETYVENKIADEYAVDIFEDISSAMPGPDDRAPRRNGSLRRKPEKSTRYAGPAPSAAQVDWDDLLKSREDGFSETLLKLIDRSGEKDSTVYKRANVDRKLFSKIRNNPNYKPSKNTVLAFAIALRLTLRETQNFLSSAGYTLSHSSKGDIIVEYFISHGEYNIFEINEVLFAYDQILIGG